MIYNIIGGNIVNKEQFDKRVFLNAFLNDNNNKNYSISRYAPRYIFPIKDMMSIIGKKTAIEFVVEVQAIIKETNLENEIEIEDIETGNIFRIDPERFFIDDKLVATMKVG